MFKLKFNKSLDYYIAFLFSLFLVLKVKTAIPMVMGANVGTSLTSTLVSLTQVTDRAQFERAFAGKQFYRSFAL